ncbi:MAG: glutathione S-transferase family protein [Rhodoferax sp.]|jgi:glutathione S-transferase|nr:glutathione S-transferase family protein [Rhodoferax sp.]
MTQTRTDALRLHDYELSGNCYKVRLLLHWLGLDYVRIPVDFHPGRAHRSADFRTRVNPRGQLPVLQDGELTLPDAQAILVYLASRYDPQGRWYPDDPATRGRITLWLATADDLTRTVSAARLHLAFGYPADLPACQQGGRAVLRLLDDQLAENACRGLPWLAADHPTIADIACFPYAALAGEAGIELLAFPALQAWISALRHQPGFLAMPGILDPAL